MHVVNYLVYVHLFPFIEKDSMRCFPSSYVSNVIFTSLGQIFGDRSETGR